MLNKALKIVAVLMLAGVASGQLPLNGLAMPQGQPAGATTLTASAASSEAASSKPERLPAVCGVSIKPAADGAAVIDITTTKHIPCRVMHLSNPPRLVVDFEGARIGVRRRAYQAQSEVLSGVRVGQWRSTPTAVVRVVADLAGSPSFGVHQQAWGVRVELKPRMAESRRAADPNPFTYRGRAKDVRQSGEVAPGKARSPSAEFPVHQFSDLTASLTTPELPPQDHIVPLLKKQSLDEARGDSGKLALVYGVSIKPDADGETLVDIASSQSVPYRVFQLANPQRLVVDLKDARDTSQRDVYRVESPVLKQVRVGQWRSGEPSVVRIVADLEGSPFFDVHAQQPGVRIDLKPRRDLGPLIRNPFEFTRQSPSVKISRPSDAATYLPAARTAPSRAPGEITLSDLKVLGYLAKPGAGTEAIVSDDLSIYFVPEGGDFEDRFRLLKITGKAVEIEDLNTKQSAWLQFTP